jgi:hypothetical protein
MPTFADFKANNKLRVIGFTPLSAAENSIWAALEVVFNSVVLSSQFSQIYASATGLEARVARINQSEEM